MLNHRTPVSGGMKRIALNRKSGLFAGSLRERDTAAILSRLRSSCRRHGMRTQVYFTQLLVNPSRSPLSRLHTWLPEMPQRRQHETT